MNMLLRVYKLMATHLTKFSDDLVNVVSYFSHWWKNSLMPFYLNQFKLDIQTDIESKLSEADWKSWI